MSLKEDLKLTEHEKASMKLVLAGILTLVLWNIPFGSLLLYPLSILGTWFHEMGHGLTALLMGGSFDKLELFSNGSGLAYYSFKSTVPFYETRQALISAGGLVGPPIVGALFIISGRNKKSAQIAFFLLVALMISSAIIWIRSIFGFAFMIPMSILFLYIALKAKSGRLQFAIQFLGMQAIVSTYRQWDYLFTKQVIIGGKEMLSDTGSMAENLWIPYWACGGIIAIFSFFILYLSLRFAYPNK